MANKPEIQTVLNFLAAAYPGKFQLVTVGAITTADVYADALADILFDALKAACKQWVADAHDWPPTAGQLRQAALRLITPALPTWGDAWDEVIRQMAAVGSWGMPRWSHPLIGQAVAGMGGWQTMCAMEIADTATWRAQFRDVYGAYAARADADAKLLPAARAVAEAYGALPAPADPAGPALPAPLPADDAPAALPAEQPLRFKRHVAAWRAAGREEREANTRGQVAEYLAAQESA